MPQACYGNQGKSPIGDDTNSYDGNLSGNLTNHFHWGNLTALIHGKTSSPGLRPAAPLELGVPGFLDRAALQ